MTCDVTGFCPRAWFPGKRKGEKLSSPSGKSIPLVGRIVPVEPLMSEVDADTGYIRFYSDVLTNGCELVATVKGKPLGSLPEGRYEVNVKLVEKATGKPTSGPLDPAVILPIFGLAPGKILNGGFEAAAVIIGMPLVLLIAVGGEIRNARLAAVCRFLGKYSFPLYCTHYSFTILQRVWRDAHPQAPWQMHLATVCACAFFALINAYVAMLVLATLPHWQQLSLWR